MKLPNAHLPVTLNEEEMENPRQVITELFSFDDLPGLKEILWMWYTSTITGTYLDKNHYTKSDRVYIHALYEHLEKMEAVAVAHKRHSGISFKIVEYSPSKVVFQVVQEKHAAGNYHPSRRLVEIVHETFDKFFPDHRVMANTIPYKESPASRVSSEWIHKKMLKYGIRIKDIAEDTGIDRSQLNALITGNRPLSQPMKALFWLYFQVKELNCSPS